MTTMIYAASENNVIGVDGRLPWYLPEDLQFFKHATIGRPIIMGYNTWHSLPVKPLPKRTNIVVSDTPIEGADKTITKLENIPHDAVIIGGATLYNLAINFVDTIFVTTIGGELNEAEYNTVTYGPEISLKEFKKETSTGWLTSKGGYYLTKDGEIDQERRHLMYEIARYDRR